MKPKRLITKTVICIVAVGIVIAISLYQSREGSAIDPTFRFPELHAGTGSPGAITAEQPENPEFFALVKTDWPLLNIETPRTAWEYVQRGMYKQDDLEDEDGAVEDYLHAEELLEEIAQRLNDPTLPERMVLIHSRLGTIYLRRGEYESAIRHFESILDENPESEGINREIALAYAGIAHEEVERGEDPTHSSEAAYEHFVREIENAPNNQTTLYEFGLFLQDPDLPLGNVDEAALALQMFQRYMVRAKYHCSTTPLRILKVARKIEELGGEVDEEVIEACVRRGRVF